MSEQDWADKAAGDIVSMVETILKERIVGHDDCVKLGAEFIRKESIRSAPDARLRECLGKVAASKDKEATAYPVWYIVDPRQMLRLETGFAMSMITGPFFSRESATKTMTDLKHRFRNPKVYCDSGHLSDDWKELYEASRAALSETAPISVKEK